MKGLILVADQRLTGDFKYLLTARETGHSHRYCAVITTASPSIAIAALTPHSLASRLA
jgi:hypothetical protein